MLWLKVLFKFLKFELGYHRKLKNQTQAKVEIFEFIEISYNKQRIHASLNHKTPLQIENKFYKN